MRVQRIVFAGLLLACICFGVSRASEQPSITSPLEAGAWKEVSGEGLLRIEAERLVIFENGGVKAVAILGKADDRITVRNQGLKEVWKLTLADSMIRLEREGGVSEFRAFREPAPELDLTPLPLGSPQKLSPERVKMIQEELLKRRDLDQSVRKDPAQKARQPMVDTENFRYLEQLLKEVGWIDADRFGKAATAAAIVLAKHSGDPRVMQSILPLIEKDVKRSMVSADLYSILFDGLQLSLGRKQRFGSQLWEDEKGPFVVPLEDPSRVDEFRKEIGLPSLSEYRKQASEYLYENKEVRLLSEN
jgi:hypothetical protein